MHRDYFEDYGQNQISAIQFSPTGQYLAIVTDDRWAGLHLACCQTFYCEEALLSVLLFAQSSSYLGAWQERDGNADGGGQGLQRLMLQLPPPWGRRCHGVQFAQHRDWKETSKQPHDYLYYYYCWIAVCYSGLVPPTITSVTSLFFGDRTRDGHVRFWRAPVKVPSLSHLCRSILRHSVSTHQIEPLPLPKRILQFLTYRNIPDRLKTCCSSEDDDW